ncbi:MAG: hypothetical protein QW576_06155, partial [Candidatus Korarchaeum sp.]
MRKLLLDSSFLLGLTELPISMEDLLSLYPRAELLTTASVVRELSSIRDKGARVSLEVLRKYGVRILETYSSNTTDDDILKAAKELGCAVATLDLELRRKLSAEPHEHEMRSSKLSASLLTMLLAALSLTLTTAEAQVALLGVS